LTRLYGPAALVALAGALAPALAVAQQPEGARTDSVVQRDLMDVISRVLHGQPKLADTIELPPKVVVTVLPAISANPTVGVLLGVSGNVVTRLGDDEATNLSTISASVSYTTKSQFNLLLRSNIYAPGNAWKLEGDWRYLDTNQPTYGLGPALPSELEAPMDFKLLRLYETVYREVVPNVLVGVGYHLNYYFGIVDHNAVQGLTPFLTYYSGQPVTATTSSGFSFNILNDTRDNPINPKKGHYVRGGVHIYPTWLGSDDDWQSIEAEYRTYHRAGAGGRNILALWGLAWFTMGRAPYLDLPAIGWDYSNRMGRGYAQGRIRAGDLLYGEAEYRMTLTRNGMWGAVGFLNLTSASDDTGALQAPNLGGGVGLRLKLDKRSDTNITIDIGFGAQGSNGVFFGTNEAF